jgi:hypothetical protein
VVTPGALAPLSALDPGQGLDWCDPLLLEWSLALELAAAGRVLLAPLLIGPTKPDGTIGLLRVGGARVGTLPNQVRRDEHLHAARAGTLPTRCLARDSPRAALHASAQHGALPSPQVSHATLLELHVLARRFGFRLSDEAPTRTVRDGALMTSDDH